MVSEEEGFDIIKTLDILLKTNLYILDGAGFNTDNSNSFVRRYCYNLEHETEDTFKTPPKFLKQFEANYANRSTDNITIYTNVSTLPSLNYIWTTNFNFDAFSQVSMQLFTTTYIFRPNNILMLNVSGSQFRFTDMSVYGLTKMRMLDVSRNELQNIRRAYFQNFSSLTHLFLQDNKLYLHRIPFREAFEGAGNIKVLDMSRNQLKVIESDSFFNLKSLRSLKLAGNAITDFSIDLSYLPFLKLIDLSSNTIGYLKKDFVNSLELTEISVDISNNPFICDCSSIDFNKWMTSRIASGFVHGDGYICLKGDERRNLTNFDVDSLIDECNNSKTEIHLVYIYVSSCLIIFVILIVLCRVFKWKLLWYLYSIKRKLVRNKKQQLIEMSHYDVFVSCSSEDMNWVTENLLPELEGRSEFKLCLAPQDFEVEAPVVQNIAESIDKSRKTVLIVTPSFVECNWCDLEMNMALSKGKNNVIVCLIKDIEPKTASRVLRKLLKTLNYIPYSVDEHGQQLFWRKLKDALRNPSD